MFPSNPLFELTIRGLSPSVMLSYERWSCSVYGKKRVRWPVIWRQIFVVVGEALAVGTLILTTL